MEEKQDGLININKPTKEALLYSEMSDKEAEKYVSELKDKIKELAKSDQLKVDPSKLNQLRELKSTLAWFKRNKLRSKHFKMESKGMSMRKAKRHPQVHWLKDNKVKDENSSNRRSSKKGHKRKNLQISDSKFSKLYREKQADKGLGEETE